MILQIQFAVLALAGAQAASYSSKSFKTALKYYNNKSSTVYK